MNKDDEMEKYRLAATVYGFYDYPMLSIGDEIPVWHDLFTWKVWSLGAGGNKIDSSLKLMGDLKEERFDTIDKKIAYLKGCVTSVKIDYANSGSKVERIKKWSQEVAYQYGIWGPIVEHIATLHTVPLCNRLVFDPKFVDFISNYSFGHTKKDDDKQIEELVYKWGNNDQLKQFLTPKEKVLDKPIFPPNQLLSEGAWKMTSTPVK